MSCCFRTYTVTASQAIHPRRVHPPTALKHRHVPLDWAAARLHTHWERHHRLIIACNHKQSVRKDLEIRSNRRIACVLNLPLSITAER